MRTLSIGLLLASLALAAALEGCSNARSVRVDLGLDPGTTQTTDTAENRTAVGMTRRQLR